MAIKKYYKNEVRSKAKIMRSSGLKKQKQLKRNVASIRWTNSHIDSTFDR